MKNKITALQILSISLICVFSFFLGGIFTNSSSFRFNNQEVNLNNQIKTASTSAQSLSGSINNLNTDFLNEKTKYVYVVYFKHTSDIITDTDDVMNKMKNAFNVLNESVQTYSSNDASIIYTELYNNANNGQLILNIDEPTDATNSSVYNLLTDSLNSNANALREGFDKNNINLMFVYIGNLQNFANDSENELFSSLNDSFNVYNHTYSAVNIKTTSENSNLEYYYNNGSYNTTGSVSVKNYSVVHGNVLCAMNATGTSNIDAYTYSVRSYARAIMLRNALNLLGMPVTSYIKEDGSIYSGYAGYWDVLSNGPVYARQNAFYSAMLGWNSAPAIEYITTTGSKNITLSNNKIYVIEPSATKYSGQAIVITPFSSYNGLQYAWSWDSNDKEPTSDIGFTVARVNTLIQDGVYANASSSFIPYYIFSPTTSDVETRDSDAKLNNSYIDPEINTTIGNLEIKDAVENFNTGYISLFDNVNKMYDNSQLKITIIDYDTSNGVITLNFECNNPEVLPPNATSELLSSIKLDTDVAILLYNIYIDYNWATISSDPNYSSYNAYDLFYTDQVTDQSSEEENLYATWQDFCSNPIRKEIFDKIKTLDSAFSSLISLDLSDNYTLRNYPSVNVPNCRNIKDLTFLSKISFLNLTYLSICNQDLSDCSKTDSPLSLKYFVNLKSLKYLELVNDNINSIDLLSCIADSDDDHPTSKLEKVSLLYNNLTNISTLNHFGNLKYVNVGFNNLTNESLNTKYRNTNSTFFTNSNFDIGLQRMPKTLMNTTPSTYVLKNWLNSSDVVVNSNNAILSYSSDFSDNTSRINGQTTSSSSDSKIEDKPLEHGRYKIEEFSYYSLIDTNTNRTVHTIEAQYCNCFFLSFTYDTEEVCQTNSSQSYDYGLQAYNSLNPLKNFSNENYIKIQHQVYAYTSEGTVDYTPIEGGLDLINTGSFEISYIFKLQPEFKKRLSIESDDDIVVTKKVVVYPYTKILFSKNSAENTITDATLYKLLLVVSGKQQMNNVASANFNDLYLGTNEDFTLYNQDLYFYTVTDKHTPSILTKRIEDKKIISSLDLNAQATKFYKTQNKLQDRESVPSGIILISSLSGMQYMNLSSITNLNLNSLGFSDLEVLLTQNILPSIETLNASENKITEENIQLISNLKTLKYLDLSFNQIADAKPIKPLTDPYILNSNGLTTQTLLKVNLAFNQLLISDSSKELRFVLEDSVPLGLDSFKPQNQIYIILVQRLTDYDVYANNSKWEYYYTPAIETTSSLKTTNTKNKKFVYSVKLTATGVSGLTLNNETFILKNNYTGFSTAGARYTISLNYNSDNAKEDKLPFNQTARSLHYTVVTASIKRLEDSFTNFPNSLTLENSSQMNDNTFTYNMLSTEYEDFVNTIIYNQYLEQYQKDQNKSDSKYSKLQSNNSCNAKYKTQLSKEDFIKYYTNPTDNGSMEFVNALNNAGFVIGFGAYVSHVLLGYGNAGTTGSTATYWSSIYGTTSSYWQRMSLNTSLTIYTEDGTSYSLPITIQCRSVDSSKSSDPNNMYMQLEYRISFNRSNPFVTKIQDDPFAKEVEPQQTDFAVFFIKIKIIPNPAISIADSNLEHALKVIASIADNEDLHAYDLYNVLELNLSSYAISTFAKRSLSDYGFDSLVFKNLTKIYLSNNKLTNTQSLYEDSSANLDPLYFLFKNTSIFSQNAIIAGTTYTFKLEYLDLSYNNLTFISSINEGCFRFENLTVNMFGNKIDFIKQQVNLTFIKNEISEIKAKVIIGLQGLDNTTSYLVSFKENIDNYNDEDSRARFYFYQGNITPTNEISVDAPGAKIYITYDETDNNNPLFYTFYYSDTYYQGNKNYTVTYRANYTLSNGQDIPINFNSTIVHQKIYIKSKLDEDGAVISSDGILHEDFCSDTLDKERYDKYVQSILDKDVFTYENCSPSDFIINYDVVLGSTTTHLSANFLTYDQPFGQRYFINHKNSISDTKSFVKEIHIEDKTKPVIITTKESSQEKYVVTKGKTYNNYAGTQNIDHDISVYDEFDNHFNKIAKMNVKIYKDGVLVSEKEAKLNETTSNLGIDINEVGSYKIVYTATDSNGNVSEPYTRIIEVYYQPYSWIKLTDFSATFVAGEITLSAMVYRNEENINQNTDPTFYWYLDGEFVCATKKSAELSNDTNFTTEATIFVQGSGTHNINVYVDITKEAFEENTKLSDIDLASLSLTNKSTQVFILLDNNVIKYSSIGISVFVVLVILLIIGIKIRKHKKDIKRNRYDYNIQKHNRRK